MTDIIPRLALFTVLPVLLGAGVAVFDRTTAGPLRRAEAFLIPLFLVGVGGGGMAAFIAHVFIAEPGSPLQRQLGFASLAIALLGAVAAERRDGFREATVVAAAVFGASAAVVQLMDIAATGGVAPGSLLQGAAGLAVPALLIWFLVALRRAEREEEVNILLRGWMIPLRRASVAAVAIAALAFAAGYASGQAEAAALAGIAVAAMVFWWIVGQSTTHRVRAQG